MLLVTLSALLGALIFPCVKGTNKELLLNTFVGLAVSTLTSEAMLHLLPSVSITFKIIIQVLTRNFQLWSMSSSPPPPSLSL